MDKIVTVVGAGLAGCEAAVALARGGLQVRLLDMKPAQFSPAHNLDGPAELVCSNSLKSDSLDTAHGLLKWELRQLGSVVLKAADHARVPAGSALAVDRRLFSEEVEKLLSKESRIEYTKSVLVSDPPEGDVVLATGPLTSPELVSWLKQYAGCDQDLYFYDALAPIVSADSLDMGKIFAGSRWGKGGDDYLNCPMDEDEYGRFVEALRTAQRTPLHDFEEPKYFESCLPVEVLADRGDDVLAFGPMRPVGLEHDGTQPHAVVQLRPENSERSAFNLVGFQTKLTYKAQDQVFRLIPGLENVEFLRYGAVHRNLFVNSPVVLDDEFRLKAAERVRLTGQIVGVEGYMESAAMGLLLGLMMVGEAGDRPLTPPPLDTALGALWNHVRGKNQGKVFEPMNIHFGLLPPVKARGRSNRRKIAVKRARVSFANWLEQSGLGGVS